MLGVQQDKNKVNIVFNAVINRSLTELIGLPILTI